MTIGTNIFCDTHPRVYLNILHEISRPRVLNEISRARVLKWNFEGSSFKMKFRGLEFKWNLEALSLFSECNCCVPSSLLSWHGSCRRCLCEFPHVVAVAVDVCAVLLVLWLMLLNCMLASLCHCSMLSSMLVLVPRWCMCCSGCVAAYAVDGRVCLHPHVIVLAVDARAGFFIVVFVDSRVRVIVVAVDARSSLCTHCCVRVPWVYSKFFK